MNKDPTQTDGVNSARTEFVDRVNRANSDRVRLDQPDPVYSGQHDPNCGWVLTRPDLWSDPV